MAIYIPNSTFIEQSEEVPLFYRWRVLGIVLTHLLAAVVCEEFIAKSSLVQRLIKIIRNKKLPKSKFKRIDLEIKSRSASWLGVTSQLMPKTASSEKLAGNSSRKNSIGATKQRARSPS